MGPINVFLRFSGVAKFAADFKLELVSIFVIAGSQEIALGRFGEEGRDRAFCECNGVRRMPGSSDSSILGRVRRSQRSLCPRRAALSASCQRRFRWTDGLAGVHRSSVITAAGGRGPSNFIDPFRFEGEEARCKQTFVPGPEGSAQAASGEMVGVSSEHRIARFFELFVTSTTPPGSERGQKCEMNSLATSRYLCALAALATPALVSAQAAIPSRGFNALVGGPASLVTVGGSVGGGASS
ncbi:hypothetical protein BDK51DRAFT_52603 [Blyttiomyces helicus]|uniref:Uncharacterized protein n=1 Tax=Blyttiomyces helicus TaxID=388810 RepID=A0A4P9WCV5_9FUNG|nr:hypothetical protein BDK51DRAFT_52603 [Blyttiomyces helicus]|eukprot:RKO89453.1 hypothetical protein BDK51DRAFT_52603 [Blyttiomyces helicus]